MKQTLTSDKENWKATELTAKELEEMDLGKVLLKMIRKDIAEDSN